MQRRQCFTVGPHSITTNDATDSLYRCPKRVIVRLTPAQVHVHLTKCIIANPISWGTFDSPCEATGEHVGISMVSYKESPRPAINIDGCVAVASKRIAATRPKPWGLWPFYVDCVFHHWCKYRNRLNN